MQTTFDENSIISNNQIYELVRYRISNELKIVTKLGHKFNNLNFCNCDSRLMISGKLKV